MPVRSLTQSVMRWPDPDQVMRQVKAWVGEQAVRVPSLERVAVFGIYGRGTAGVGSDLASGADGGGSAEGQGGSGKLSAAGWPPMQAQESATELLLRRQVWAGRSML